MFSIHSFCKKTHLISNLPCWAAQGERWVEWERAAAAAEAAAAAAADWVPAELGVEPAAADWGGFAAAA